MIATQIRLPGMLRMFAAVLGLSVSIGAQALSPAPATWPAGDALRGKALYDTPTGGLAGPSCGNSSCHGPAINQAKKLSRGNNNPGVINSAILAGTMTNTWLRAMTAQQLADVAAFTANPNVSAGMPAATVSGSGVFPGTTVGGASATQTLTLSNTGTGALTLTSVASSSAVFKVIAGGTCAAGSTVAVGASCTVAMTFNPTVAGAAIGTLTFTHNASPTTSTVALSGSGVSAAAPVASATPSLTFASTTVGATSASQTVTLSNTGTASLSLAGFASNNAAFTVSGGTCTAPGTVAANGTCTVVVAFKPTAVGAASGTLTFTHNATPTTTAVALSGTGAAATPIASVTPTTLAFSQVLAGTSSNQTVTVSNTGAAPLSISSIAISGAQASEFAKGAAGTCVNGGTVAVGASCTVLINFTPSAAGARVGSLDITHNATGSPTKVALNGTGTSTPQPVLNVNNNALSFTAQPLASTSAAKTVTVSNLGQAPLILSSMALGGTNSADFSLGGTCAAGTSMAVNATCTLTVTFSPKALGARAASLTLSSNAAAPVTISLNGTAVAAPAPEVTLAPAAQAFGTATIGAAPLTRTVTLTNSGTAALAVTSITVTGAGFTGANDCGASVAAGASCTLTLSFNPGSAASLTGLASVVSNAAGSPHTVALSGTGVVASLAVLAWSGTPAGAFADTSVGSISTPATLTLVNQGPGSATLNSVSMSGANAAEFLAGGNCVAGTVVAVGANCTVTVALAPAQVGPRAATLNVATNGTAPAAVALSGNGVISAQQLLAVSTTTVNFPPAAAGDSVSPMPVTVTNTGTAPITVTALTLSNPAFAAAPVAGALPVTLAPAQALNVNVTLNAAAAGELTDTLTVVTNTAGVSRTLAITASVTGSASQTPAATNVGEGGGSFDFGLALMCSLALAALWRSRRAR